MTTPPNLGPRAIQRYNRFAKELAAFNYVLRSTKLGGPVSLNTLITLNGLVRLANRLFNRLPDMPRFWAADLRGTMTQADLAVYVARLTAASLHFEQRYAHLTEEGVAASLQARLTASKYGP